MSISNLVQKFLPNKGGYKYTVYSSVDPTKLIYEGDSLYGVHLDTANFQACNLKGLNLTKAELRKADLQCANLKGATLRFAILSDACLRGANLQGADLQRAVGYKSDFSNAHLKKADLKKASFNLSDFSGAIVKGANFSGADLSRSIFRGTDLTGVDFTGAHLTGVDFTGSNIKGAIFTGADLRESIFDSKPEQIKLPPEGELIVYKKVVARASEYSLDPLSVTLIAKLRIPKEARRICSTSLKCRAEYAEVLEFTTVDGRSPTFAKGWRVYSGHNPSFEYKIGGIVKASHPSYLAEYIHDWRIECGPGIHFFLKRKDAVEYPFL